MSPISSHEKYKWGEPTEAERGRLSTLKLTHEEFHVFRREFIGSPWDFALNSGDGPRNVSAKVPLSNDMLLRHLEGGPIISTRCGFMDAPDGGGRRYETSWLWFDLDAGPDLAARYDRLREAFPACPLVFQSSGSGGLHCLFRLEDPLSVFKLSNREQQGSVPRILASTNLELRPGYVELYPQPWMREWRGNAIRVPFGKGSLVLCPEELIPLCATGVASLRYVAQRLADEKLDVLTHEVLNRLDANASRRRGRPKRRGHGPQRDPSSLAEECARLERDGLTGPGQLNDALFRLSNRYAWLRLSLDDAESRLLDWLDSQHNRQSRTYNRSPAQAREEARQVLSKAYATYKPAREWAPAPGLSATDVARLDLRTAGGCDVADRNGVAHPRRKYLRFLFDVTCGAKQWVLTMATDTARRVQHTRPTFELDSPEFDRAFDDRVRPWWPYLPLPLFAVDLPYSFRRRIDGVSEPTMNAFWARARADGLFPLARGASAWGERSAAYLVDLDFASTETFQSLDEALAHCLPSDVIAERFGPHAARVIRASPTVATGTRLRSMAEEYAWRRLRGEAAISPPMSPALPVRGQEAAA